MSGLIKAVPAALGGGSVNGVLTQRQRGLRARGGPAGACSELREHPTHKRVTVLLREPTTSIRRDLHRAWLVISMSFSCGCSKASPSPFISFLWWEPPHHNQVLCTHLVPGGLLPPHNCFGKNSDLSAPASFPLPKKGASPLHGGCPVCWEHCPIAPQPTTAFKGCFPTSHPFKGWLPTVFSPKT